MIIHVYKYIYIYTYIYICKWHMIMHGDISIFTQNMYIYTDIHIFVGRSILCLTRFSLCPPNSPGLSPSHWLSPCNVEQGRDPLLHHTWNCDWVG